MGLQLENKTIKKIYVGNKEVTDIYQGIIHKYSKVHPSPTIRNHITFESSAENTLSLSIYGGASPLFYYSYDLVEWYEWDYSELPFNNNTPLHICGKNTTIANTHAYKYATFKIAGNGKVFCSGSIQSLLNYEKVINKVPAWCFYKMFDGCTSLVQAPELPATTLADYCYYYMFYGCSSLVTVPELPATTLTKFCYYYMFYGCSSLVTVPELPATTLAECCYFSMFYRCNKLNYIKCLAIDKTAYECTRAWVYGISSSGTFVKHPDATWPSGTSGIPEGWTVQNAEL